MSNYHIFGNRKQGYSAKREGASRIAGHFETKKEAELRGKVLVAKSGGGELKIHNDKGRIQDSDTVAPGNDPNPPRDKVL